MTIEQFENFSPSPESINIYFSASVISAVNISNVDCNGSNVADSLQKLTTLTVNIDDNVYTLDIVNSTAKDDYYFYNIDPITVPSVIDQTCSDTQLVPYPGRGSFDTSDYNAILNNATVNTTTGYIYDVDRAQTNTLPINYQSIMSGSGTPAEFQELNYSSVGIINSRYNGSKTTTEEYGISPAFTGITLDGAIYSVSQTTGYICSQSAADRSIEDIIIGYDASATPSFDGSTQDIDSISINYTPLAKFFYNNGTISDSDTTLNLNTYLDINPGDLIRIKQGTLSNEVLRVETVTLKSSSSTQFTVTRAYKSNIDPNNTAEAFYNGALTVSKLTGTQLFKADGNKLFKLSNKKVWIKDNLKVFYIDEAGQVIFELLTCSL